MENSEKLCLSVEEARKRIGLGKNLMYRYIENGTIPSIKFGRKILIPVAALSKYLETAGAGAKCA